MPSAGSSFQSKLGQAFSGPNGVQRRLRPVGRASVPRASYVAARGTLALPVFVTRRDVTKVTEMRAHAHGKLPFDAL